MNMVFPKEVRFKQSRCYEVVNGKRVRSTSVKPWQRGDSGSSCRSRSLTLARTKRKRRAMFGALSRVVDSTASDEELNRYGKATRREYNGEYAMMTEKAQKELMKLK